MHTTEGPKSLTTEGHFTTGTPKQSNPTTEMISVSNTQESTVSTATTRFILDYSMFHTTQCKYTCIK